MRILPRGPYESFPLPTVTGPNLLWPENSLVDLAFMEEYSPRAKKSMPPCRNCLNDAGANLVEGKVILAENILDSVKAVEIPGPLLQGRENVT